MNLAGIFTCGEDIKFGGSPESWPIFRVELNVILLNHGLLLVISTSSGAVVVETPPKLFLQSICIGRVLCMSVNNMTLWWPMGQ